ncbi:hypothetical protein Ahy_B01g052024 isoform D [Arachis hypogaea]|uniref:SKP1-like protein 11 n=1 Tax=Arachis hypogaea TaxID=3818 RepID=A0A445ANI3_ARAHY|nr:hypothetical protein Ahy_B01g052024 isoform D [Arachis hypogaea]
MGKRGEHIVHLGRGGEGRGGFDMCGVQPSPPPFVAVRGVFLRTVGVIQVKPPVPCLLPRSAPILHRILPARGRPVTVVVVSSPSRSVYSLPGKTDGAFVHQTMDKWPSSNLMGSPLKKIMLCSSEKEIFSVEEQVMVQHSVIINNMIEDGSYNHEESKIPLDCVDSKTLKKVIDYCTHHTHHQNDNQEDLEAWDAQFLNVDSNGLYDLLMAANYLEIRDLLDLIYRSIKNMIKGKKIDEIRRIFNIKDHGFTPEEEEQNRKEYPHFY